MRRSLDLVVIVVQTYNICARELGDFPRRPADTTAYVENFHSLPHTHHVCKIMLVSGNGLVEAFSVGKPAEVE